MHNDVASGRNPKGPKKETDPIEDMGIIIADALIRKYKVDPYRGDLVATFDRPFRRRTNSAAIRAWAVGRLRKEGAIAGDDGLSWMDVLEREFATMLRESCEPSYN